MQLVPKLTRNQWLWLGGAAALGVTEVVSAPIALVLAALPVLDNIAGDGEDGSSARRSGSSNGGARRRAGTRRGARGERTTSPRRRSARTAPAQ